MKKYNLPEVLDWRVCPGFLPSSVGIRHGTFFLEPGRELRIEWDPVAQSSVIQLSGNLAYKVVPPRYKLVYNPHEYYRYITYKLQKKLRFPTATFDDTAMGTGWCPPVISGFIIPMNTIVISAINHSEMGLICTNLANELGHHLVAMQHRILKM